MSKFQSTKCYGHEQGLSCCFRQWRAKSHCNQIHGYSLAFKFVFGADTLDDKFWVQDFGGLKQLKKELQFMFDHTLIVAQDDPEIETFRQLGKQGLASVREVQSTGCESFAKLGYDIAESVVNRAHWDMFNTVNERVVVVSCEVAEHAGNSAIYFGV